MEYRSGRMRQRTAEGVGEQDSAHGCRRRPVSIKLYTTLHDIIVLGVDGSRTVALIAVPRSQPQPCRRLRRPAHADDADGFGRFDLAYFRHTDRWFTVYGGLTAADCFREIEDNEVFWPTS
jgi:hypothetical protein